MKLSLKLGAVVAMLIVLAGCTVSVFIGSLVDRTVSAEASAAANLSNESPTTTFSLSGGERIVLEVDVPSSGAEALFLYTDAEVDVRVYDGNGALFASSSGPSYFATGSLGIASASTSVDPQVVEAQLCPGSCVVRRATGSETLYATVTNPFSTTRSIGFYAILDDFDDQNEGAEVSFSSAESGAIETLGDQDRYVAGDGGTLFLDGTVGSAITFEAEIFDPFGQNPTRTVRDGDSIYIDLGEEITVYAVNQRAGVSAASTYFLEIGP